MHRWLFIAVVVLAFPSVSSAQFFPDLSPCLVPPPRFEAIVREGGVWIFWGEQPVCAPKFYQVQLGRFPGATQAGFYFGPPTDRLKQYLGSVSQFQPGEWFVRLIAYDEFSLRSLPSEEIQIRIHEPDNTCPVPPTPLNFSASVGARVQGGTMVTLLWSTGGTPTGCRPARHLLVVGFAPNQVGAVIDVGDAPRPLTVLAPSGRYFVRVVGYVPFVGQSAPSAEIRVDVP